MKLKIDIYNINNKFTIDRDRIKNLLNLVFMREQHDYGNVSIIFVGHDYIADLNQKYLDKQETTDVLSFSLSEDTKAIDGEIYVDLDTVAINAETYKVTFEQEALRMVVHGLLHLMGYDDGDDVSREMMTIKEDHYLGLVN